MRPAVFLDRDGTLIEDVDYLSDPAKVRLINGAAGAVHLLQSAGYACVVITNQSAIGRGLLTVDVLEKIHAEMHRQLALHDVRLDGVYYCPIAPLVPDRTTVEHPDRKPGPGMVFRAARELGLDVARSWMVGDMLSDMLCGRNAGCQGTILVQTGKGRTTVPCAEAVDYVVEDILAAARLIVSKTGWQPAAEESSRHA